MGDPSGAVRRWVSTQLQDPRVQRAAEVYNRVLPTVARVLVCLYFINVAVSQVTFYWSYNVPGFPFVAIVLLPCSVLTLVGVNVPLFGSFLAFVALKEAVTLVFTQLLRAWAQGQGVFINELMVKKFSVLGCVTLMVANDPYFKKKITDAAKALMGLIVSEDRQDKRSKWVSVALLVARLLISTLFLYIGWGEVTRQLKYSQGVMHGAHIHRMADGDGHNSMLPKVTQLLLGLPFLIGFKTRHVAVMLAVSLILESLVYWQFWTAPAAGLPFWYNIHARDHFTVNLAVAGGLLLLQRFGAGKYTVDALLKKKE